MEFKCKNLKSLRRLRLICGIVIIVCSSTALVYGQNWHPVVRLTTAGASAVQASIAVLDNNIHVVWSDYRDNATNGEIYYKRSNNNGQNWTPGERLTNNAARSEDPSIAVSGDKLHVVWCDNRDGNFEIYYKRSTNNGDFWHPDVRLTTAGHSASYPAIAVFGDTLHVVWEDWRHGNTEIYYKRSTDNGQTWTPGVRLTNDSAESIYPRIGVFGVNVYVVWQDSRDGNPEVYFKRSTDNGDSWHPDVRLTTAGAGVSTPSVAAFENNIHVVWGDLRNYSCCGEIYYKRSEDEGSSWTPGKRLTFDGAESGRPSIAAFFGNVYVVWTDKRDGNKETYFKNSFDNGENWEADNRLTSQSAESRIPSVATFAEDIHVVWEDSRDGNFEIYYRHGTLSVAVEEPIAGVSNGSYLSAVMNENNAILKYGLVTSGRVSLSIYDVKGSVVRALLDEARNPGHYTLIWDGRDNLGNQLANGIYFCNIQASKYQETEKIILLK